MQCLPGHPLRQAVLLPGGCLPHLPRPPRHPHGLQEAQEPGGRGHRDQSPPAGHQRGQEPLQVCLPFRQLCRLPPLPHSTQTPLRKY